MLNIKYDKTGVNVNFLSLWSDSTGFLLPASDLGRPKSPDQGAAFLGSPVYAK